MSWKPEIQTIDSAGQWYPNGLRFATEAEALANVKDLQARWFGVAIRVTESDDPVNYRWVNGQDGLHGWEPGHLVAVVV